MPSRPSDADRDAALKVVSSTPADHLAADRLLGRWQARWLAPTDERVEIAIHPIALTELRELLLNDAALLGVGYSEFIVRAIRQWQADHA